MHAANFPTQLDVVLGSALTVTASVEEGETRVAGPAVLTMLPTGDGPEESSAVIADRLRDAILGAKPGIRQILLSNIKVGADPGIGHLFPHKI